MIPNFIIAGREISAYMIVAIVGVVVTVLYISHLADKHKLDEYRTTIMLVLAFGFGLLGAHLMYGIVEHETLFELLRNLDQLNSFKAFIAALSIVFGGAVYYGGIIAAILAGYLYLRWTERDRPPYHDLGAISIPLFHGFGRIGCFLSGCCYGVPWSCGVTYHYSIIDSANEVARFPVQLVEAALNFALFFVLRRLFQKGKCRGKLMNIYLIVYPVYRFLLEFLRGDAYRGFVGPFSTSQFVSLLLFAFSVVSLLIKRFKTRRAEAR